MRYYTKAVYVCNQEAKELQRPNIPTRTSPGACWHPIPSNLLQQRERRIPLTKYLKITENMRTSTQARDPRNKRIWQTTLVVQLQMRSRNRSTIRRTQTREIPCLGRASGLLVSAKHREIWVSISRAEIDTHASRDGATQRPPPPLTPFPRPQRTRARERILELGVEVEKGSLCGAPEFRGEQSRVKTKWW